MNIDISNSQVGVSGVIILNERNPYGRVLNTPFIYPQYKPKQTVFGINKISYEVVMTNTIFAYYENIQNNKKAVNRIITNNRLVQRGYNNLSSLF